MNLITAILLILCSLGYISCVEKPSLFVPIRVTKVNTGTSNKPKRTKEEITYETNKPY